MTNNVKLCRCSHEVSVLIRWSAALICLFVAHTAGAGEWISHISPDGGFAVNLFGPGSIENAELIALPSRKEIARLRNWGDKLIWAPDSRRFARTIDEGPRVSTVAIHERTGESFKTRIVINELPKAASAIKGWPKEWRDAGRGTQTIHPIRWLDADTLLLGVSQSESLRKGEETDHWRFEGLFTVRFGKGGAVSKSALVTVSNGLESVKKPVPKLVSDHLAEPREWQLSPDKSVALVEDEGVLDLIEQSGGQPERVTPIRKRFVELFLPDFRAGGAEPLDEKEPFHVEGDWFLQGSQRVVIQCEATTNPNGDQRSKMWCARLDALWDIKEAKFIEQKVVRGFCGRLREQADVRVMASSPGGAFQIEIREQLDARERATGGFAAFVVPAKGDGEPVALEQKIPQDEAASVTYRISPDERWIYAERRNSQWCRRALFARSDGFRFVPALTDPANGSDTFEPAAWDFCRRTDGFEPPASSREWTFVAWSPDSSRLLLSLRVDIKGVQRQWRVYWNTRTRSFELTPFLKDLNARAYDEFSSTLNTILQPYCAEPVDALPPLDQLDRDITAARAAFEENWTGTAAHEKQRAKKEAPKTWATVAKKAEAWRMEGIADLEKLAAEFSSRWPEGEREQWRRLSLAGGFRALNERIGSEWPWQ